MFCMNIIFVVHFISVKEYYICMYGEKKEKEEEEGQKGIIECGRVGACLKDAGPEY